MKVSTLALNGALPTQQSKAVSISCSSCGRLFSGLATRCACGGMAETTYSPAVLESGAATGFFEQFWRVLPLRSMDGVPEGLRLRSPTLRADRLRSAIGGPELWLKDEGRLPTGSTKARVGALVFPFLRQYGVQEFVVSSTGNTSTAIAWMARHYPDMRVHIFVGRDFAHRLRHVTSGNVSIHVTQGNFVAAGQAAQEFAARNDLFWEAGFFNPARRDGLKTAFIEAALVMGVAPGIYVQAVSSAMGVVGTAKGAQELSYFGLQPAQPGLVCVQQATCAPMVSAWRDHSEVIRPTDKVDHPSGIAEAILRGDPSNAYPIVYRLVRESGGTFTAVTPDEIRHAQALLAQHAGVYACEAGAAALAGYAQLVASGWLRGQDGPVLVNITGGRRDVLRST